MVKASLTFHLRQDAISVYGLHDPDLLLDIQGPDVSFVCGKAALLHGLVGVVTFVVNEDAKGCTAGGVVYIAADRTVEIGSQALVCGNYLLASFLDRIEQPG